MSVHVLPSATVRWPTAETRVDVHNHFELVFWARRFRVSREMLKRAVAAVGEKFADVDRYLYQKRTVLTQR